MVYGRYNYSSWGYFNQQTSLGGTILKGKAHCLNPSGFTPGLDSPTRAIPQTTGASREMVGWVKLLAGPSLGLSPSGTRYHRTALTKGRGWSGSVVSSLEPQPSWMGTGGAEQRSVCLNMLENAGKAYYRPKIHVVVS